MEYRPLNITVISADDIKNMNVIAKMDVYTEVSLAGYPKSKKRTFVDKDCGTNPKWNHHMDFVVDEPYLTEPGLSLVFQIMAESALRNDKEIGSVTVPVHDLFQGNSSNEDKTSEYQVRTTSGKAKGTLKFAYNFGEKFTLEQNEKHKPVEKAINAYPVVGEIPAPAPYPGMGYPPQYYQPPPPGAYPGSAYPPHQGPPGAYPGPGYPPQQGHPGAHLVYPPAGYGGYPNGYGYQGPPPPSGYGYPPGPVEYLAAQKPNKDKKDKKDKKKKKKPSGVGGALLGAGVGFLGGLIAGDIAENIGDMADFED